MARIGIYVPKFQRLGDEKLLLPLDDKIIRRETLQICKKLTKLCGGCTAIDVMGYYEFPDGFFSEAPTMEIYCFCEDMLVGKVADALKPLMTDLRLKIGM